MNTFTYTSGDGSAVLDLNDPDGVLIGQIRELRTREWDVDLGHRSLEATRSAREVKATGVIRGDKTPLETVDRVFEADLYRYVELKGDAGVLEVDGWRQPCLCVKTEPDYVSPQLTRVEFTFALLDGFWHKPVRQSFSRSTARYNGGKGYRYDYRYDYLPSRNRSILHNDSALPSRAKIIVYGAASTPNISIGGNKVIADVTVPSGGYLVIDGTAMPRTAELVAANGDRTNVYGKLHRDQSAGEYAFEPIPTGDVQIGWDESFGFDIEWWLEQTGLPWT
ncbi:hypothetical protein KIH77_08875 [Bifidobacterium sp. 82T24]|uniref:hypothetical protein n=1 Tax=Bifidobacterium pluvialisilvae TaxID=2834436 RepID=UPI001C59F35A|nr:hypothetical protein [Bifidobacterium pluvialisilvae]MBW3088833.1 hypothetical protein [Bifidobacterium pluvialisilvae]